MSLPLLPVPLSSLPRPAAPARLIRALDPRVPVGLKRRLVEPLLNRTFADPLAEGEFDALEGRRITLAIEDLGMALTLTLEGERLAVCSEPGEATIRGGWREFLCLATRREDPDALFFQRRLLIEGDTELGLMVKNLLDGREEGLAQGPFGELLVRLERLANRTS
ncbi:SCP2 sterol-binding domain-containing protein [Halomonas sp.]|uniref:ubiquinone anaerobic biosynthesis accessory factor UbiT n=1 Tax=Halomonas sp. TaxID=1486246 RepID=UPI0026084A6D|nr:SCP2 sterol-binding domain-containing protein [Halomonas sp.]